MYYSWDKIAKRTKKEKHEAPRKRDSGNRLEQQIKKLIRKGRRERLETDCLTL